MKTKNQDIVIHQQAIEELNQEATIPEENYKLEENQEPTKIKIDILPKLKENILKTRSRSRTRKFKPNLV